MNLPGNGYPLQNKSSIVRYQVTLLFLIMIESVTSNDIYLQKNKPSKVKK